jgi:hypothetical protein
MPLAKTRDLTDAHWKILDDLIPEPTARRDKRGRPWKDRRAVLNGILWVLRTGAPNLLRKDLRSKRKQLIAANLKLTDTEAAKFWPVYDQYVTELISINDKKFGLIQDYADNWGKLTNDQSLMFSRQWLDMDIAIAQLRQKYVPIVAKVLDGRKTATFFQLDRRIAMMIELQLSSQMPLVQEQ